MTRRSIRFAAGILLTNFILVVCPLADAADRFWRNPAGGTFSTAGNWGGGVPGPSDVANFSLTNNLFFPTTYTVNFTANATNQGLVIHDDNVKFDLNSRIYTTTQLEAI